ncbi:MAG TPA: 5'-nucleotidase C-terminal domain-containing protein [Candidatus Eisenbacteria bacterium]|nr:5'-nucleotidase C-terminal domain-containing protein [Candidatus Eisenbacteria bacterium]
MANRNPDRPRSAHGLRLWPLLAVLFALAAVRPALAEEATVTILHTTDLHGHLLPEEDYSGAPAPRGLARVATLVKRARAADAQALLLDAGDCIQGTPMEYVQHTQMGDKPDPMMLAMNALAYNAMAVGNHEYDFGWKTLEAAHKAARFPWLSANTLRGDKPGFDPYKVFMVHGVRVGVLGLTTPAIPYWSDADKFPGLHFADPVATAQKWVPVLRGKEHCDLVVILTHQGLERESERGREISGQMPGENAGFALAQVPGVDVVILGHTHRAMASLTTKNGTLLTQAGRWADHLGKIDVTLTRASATAPWTVSAKRADLIEVTADTPADPAIVALAEPYRAPTRAWLDQPLATATDEFDGSRARLQDTPLMDLIQAAQLEYGDADVSMSAAFSTEGKLRKGPVRMRDVASVYVYENNLYTLATTGAQLRKALEWSARYFSPYDFGRTPRPLIDPSVQGFNYDMAQGVTYTIDLTKPYGQRIQDLRFAGRPLADDQKLKVAMNSYRVNGGGGYDMWKGAAVVKKSDQGVRELLAQYVKKKQTLSPRTDQSWKLLPLWVSDPARPDFERLVRRGVWSEDEAKRIDPTAPLTRGTFATWLGRAYGSAAAKASTSRFADVPPEMTPDVARAEATGALNSIKGALLHSTEAIDLLTAVEWTALADHGGPFSRSQSSLTPPSETPDPDIYRAAAAKAPDATVLRLAQAPPQYGRMRLPAEIESYALREGFLDEWSTAANPQALTQADGARLLAAARYPWVTVLYTCDFHGAFEAQRAGNRTLGSSAALATLLARERAKNPQGTLLLDGGDLMQGTMQSNLSRGRPVIAQMNRFGYDASSVGNHEFDWSVDTLVQRVHEARFPFLAANFFDKGTTRHPAWVKPAALFDRHGVRVGVVGFCTVETPTVTMPSNVAGFEFPDETPIAERWIPRLRAKGADVVVLMGHLPASQDSSGTVKGELAKLAAGAHDEDVDLGGHSHNYVDGMVDGTPVMISAAQARALGRVDFVVDRKAGKVVESDARNLDVDTDQLPADPTMASFVDSIFQSLKPVAERVLGDAPEDMMRDRHGESRIGDWVAESMRQSSGADMAFQNPGGLRADLAAGPVTMKDVYEIMPFDNRVALVHLKGEQVLDAVETGVRGDGCVQIAGIRYSFDRSRPKGERVIKVQLADGRDLDPKATYLVATNDFMAQGGDGFDVFARGPDLRVTEILVRDALVQDIEARAKRGDKLQITLDGRIQDLTHATSENAPASSGTPGR